MGVDCKCALPHDVRLDDVRTVLGLLAGCKMIGGELGLDADGLKRSLHREQGSHFPMVPGVECKTTSVPEMVILIVPSTTEQYTPCIYYHFEYKEGRLLMARSTPLWCALAEGLVRFFGGRVDFNDCDETEADIRCEPQSAHDVEDGAEWYTFHERLFAVKPITERNYEAAAYDDNCHYKRD